MSYFVKNMVAIGSLMLGFAAPAGASILYTITDLGTLGGAQSSAYGINGAGQVVGASQISDGSDRPFLYDGGSLANLGTLGGDQGVAYAINASGQAAGQATLANGRTRAFFYNGASMIDIGTLGGANSSAAGMNDVGQVVGYAQTPTNEARAFLYQSGVLTDLAIPDSFDAFANDINNNGQIVGTHGTLIGASINSMAYRLEGGITTDLGTLGGAFSTAVANNDLGQITGMSMTAGGEVHAYLYSGGTMTDIGWLGAIQAMPTGINASGQVVGLGFTASYQGHGFLYSDGTMFDINDLIDPLSGWTIRFAGGINDRGQIVGSGLFNDITHAVLLTPLTAVPESATWAMMIAGFAAVGIGLRTRRSAWSLVRS